MMHSVTGSSTLHTIKCYAQQSIKSCAVLGSLPGPRFGTCLGFGPYSGKVGSTSPAGREFLVLPKAKGSNQCCIEAAAMWQISID